MDQKPTQPVPKWLKKLLIGLGILFVVLFIAGIEGNKSLQKKLDEAKQKCQAIELMDGSENESEPCLNYSIAKTNCDAIYTNIYESKDTEFREAVDKDYETHKNDDREVAGHKIDWYLEQVKANQ